MKKALFLFLLFTGISSSLISYAFDEANAKVITETNKITIYSIDGKIGIKDNETNAVLLKADWENFTPLDENYEEFKFTKNNNTGYLNVNLKSSFLTPYSDIALLGNYVRIKDGEKYGLLDKYGNIILPPAYEKISLINHDNKEYISGKLNGKYKLFYNTGSIIPEEKLYTISDSEYSLLAKNIKPIFKTKYNLEQNEEYKEIDNGKSLVYDVQEMEIAQKEINVINKPQNTIGIGNKDYYVTTNKDKVGLKDYDGKQIIPSDFDTIKIVTPCKHYLSPIIIAQNENGPFAYTLSGKLIAEQINSKINVYKYGLVYSYTQDGNIGTLNINGKKAGEVKFNENEYKYVKSKFSVYPQHAIVELILKLLPYSSL